MPGSAEWNVRADVVGRAMRLIGDGVVDREGVGGPAVRLRSAPPGAAAAHRRGRRRVALARAQRAHTARVLLQTTGLPITEIAFAAGFASVRQFNDTIRAVYASTPSNCARPPPRARASGPGTRRTVTPTAGIPLRLAHRGPYESAAVFDLLAHEAVPGVEDIDGTPGRRRCRRTLRPPVRHRNRRGGRTLTRLARHQAPPHRPARPHHRRPAPAPAVDLDADPYAVDERLGADPGWPRWSPTQPSSRR